MATYIIAAIAAYIILGFVVIVGMVRLDWKLNRSRLYSSDVGIILPFWIFWPILCPVAFMSITRCGPRIVSILNQLAGVPTR